MLLTPWCQKLQHYHFKRNLQFKAKEIKIRVALFLVLKHIKYREDWNSPSTSCFIFSMPLFNGTCYIEQISQYICYFPWVPFHSSTWDISLLFHEIRVRLLEDAIPDSGSANFFSLTGAKNSSNVRCSSTSVKQHQALSHCMEKATYTSLDLGQQGLFGAVWVFPVPENKSTQTIQSYIPPCPTHTVTQWDEEEPSPGKAPAAFNAPQQTQPEREQGHDPCYHYTPLSFSQRKPHCPGHRDMVSHCFLSATAGS